jgi:hypothetical protein
MKSTYLLLLFLLLINCNSRIPANKEKVDEIEESASPNRVYFNVENDFIYIPLLINDSIPTNLSFDTGGYGILLDSAFFGGNINNKKITRSKERLFFPMMGILTYKYNVKDNLKLSIGETDIIYNNYDISPNLRVDSSRTGIFNIPVNDTVHVWEINFDDGYIEIHAVNNFSPPDTDIKVPLLRNIEESKFYVNMPLQLVNEGDTLTSNHLYCLDTGGARMDIIITEPAEELNYIREKQQNIVYDSKLGKAYRFAYARFIFSSALFGQITIDSLSVSYQEESMIKGAGTIGLHLLKRFNVYLDLKKNELILTLRKNYISSDPYKAKNQQYVKGFTMGKKNDAYYIKRLPDFEGNLLKKAGVEAGDELISINNYPAKMIYERKISVKDIEQKFDSLNIIIKRNNQLIDLTCKTK